MADLWNYKIKYPEAKSRTNVISDEQKSIILFERHFWKISALFSNILGRAAKTKLISLPNIEMDRKKEREWKERMREIRQKERQTA